MMNTALISASQQQSIDELYMRRCLLLAERGLLTTAPNPMVGAVIVAPCAQSPTGGRIIGEGFHVRAGEPHAEIQALRSVAPADKALVPQSTIYVSLEPCAHHGRTPPCAWAIVKAGIRRCVVGCEDPFARVRGRGIAILREAGVEVSVNCLRRECLQLNRRFICYHSLGRPFVTLKWAASADGFLDRKRQLPSPGEILPPPAQLSSPLSRLHVHRSRASHQAILVGRRTFLLDRPRLNVRYWAKSVPQPFVLGSLGEEALQHGFEVVADIDSLFDNLRDRGIISLMVEGGQAVLQSFIERDLWDEAWEEQCPQYLKTGVPAPQMPLCFVPQHKEHFGRVFKHWQSPVLQKNYLDF